MTRFLTLAPIISLESVKLGTSNVVTASARMTVYPRRYVLRVTLTSLNLGEYYFDNVISKTVQDMVAMED